MRSADSTEKESIHNISARAAAAAHRLRRQVLMSCSIPFAVKDVLTVLTHPADRQITRVYWEQPAVGFAMAGLNALLSLDLTGEIGLEEVNDSMNGLFAELIAHPREAPAGPRFLGGFAFDLNAAPGGVWENFPLGRFILPECLVTRIAGETWLTIAKIVQPGESEKKVEADFTRTFTYYRNRLPVTLPPFKYAAVDRYKDVPDKKGYKKTVYKVLGAIKPGELEKVVISRSHYVKIDSRFSVISAMQVLRNAYGECTSFFFGFPQEGTFFGSTPEQLIHKSGTQIRTEALAGTIRRGRNIEEDRLLGDTLFNSHKEREEHQFVIDQICRRLRAEVEGLTVGDRPRIFQLKNVQHLRTEISGTLKSEKNVLDLAAILHPTPAVAGTPTDRALEVIRKLETHQRGWYSGPVGWLDPKGDGEFTVALRSALVINNEAYIYAGGGIVAESLPEKEWEETQLKLQPIISALSGGQI
ncbi:MAG: isochorismate synthase [FCB group bacterium]|nr:isochorismate synthase [FCB group bacterium]